ncbi:NAD(P)-binding protein [Clostridium fallax]|uniref:NADPH-dependent glutamate synthase beta chain n=1 Tax=Clostridium fallax TaxID=1533 RepID=A0A1M4XYX4_9CLOT|nr:NAD(P)-binding protein [Clostridium fallax]SHE98628.1 NADPH-dependent glutamate synthase beta chain [Clostridium fallax]SQB06487.1 sulfide dehydrogenase subunit alpha [Clostridium fallax]
MSRLLMVTPDKAQTVVEELYRDLERRIIASPPGICPIDIMVSFIRMCQAQTCGKCVPCRVGLEQITNLLDDVLDGNGTDNTVELIKKTAKAVVNSADCAIGYEAAALVLKGIEGFDEDFHEHIHNSRCLGNMHQPVPCVALCPAGVDIPGYISLVEAGRFDDAVRLIRKDNPFPSTCGLICEHPCEARCRRNIIDDAINIRGLKRVAVEKAGSVPAPKPLEATGKKVAVVGGGPAGLSCAYYLSLMGHKVTVFEKNSKLGGMLRYGIPNYRLPRNILEDEISVILSTGIDIKTGIEIGKDFNVAKLREDFDSVFISIGAHEDRKLGIEGEDAKGVMSAVQMLKNIGDDDIPDFTDKNVVVIGGGNVAMDVTRTAIRLGAKSVTCAYRRRKKDMTALPEEVEGAMSEGAEIFSLMSPLKIEKDKEGRVKAVWFKPQIIGEIKRGRPTPKDAKSEPVSLPCDIVIVAIGQNIGSEKFKESGIPVKRGVIDALKTSGIENIPGIFAGGDCVTGPATVIKAIESGKVAAANIDEYLGFYHEIRSDIDIPEPTIEDKPPCGRINMRERMAEERKHDMNLIELSMTDEEACQESRRCLRCDHFGFGNLRGGRTRKW